MSYDQVVNIGGGSAQPNISSSQIENCRFVVPSDALILSFTNHVDPMMQKWLSNIQEAIRLAAIRDAHATQAHLRRVAGAGRGTDRGEGVVMAETQVITGFIMAGAREVLQPTLFTSSNRSSR
jgi:restriction endonuclease S subunit